MTIYDKNMNGDMKEGLFISKEMMMMMRVTTRKLFLPLLYIVEEKGPPMQGPVAHWMRRCCLFDPSGLKHKLFWRFESSLVRLDSAYT